MVLKIDGNKVLKLQCMLFSTFHKNSLSKCGFRKKSFIMNAPLVSRAYLSSLLGGCNNKSDDKYAQLTRGAFIINDKFNIF